MAIHRDRRSDDVQSAKDARRYAVGRRRRLDASIGSIELPGPIFTVRLAIHPSPADRG
jgi:hypothetical protein